MDKEIYFVIVNINDNTYYREISADGTLDFNVSVDYAIKLTNESLAIQLAETLSERYSIECKHEQLK